MRRAHAGQAMSAMLAGLLLAATELAAGPGIELRSADDGGPDVALFQAETVMDLPGGASVVSRLEIQCSGGQIYYVLVDFGTPRIAKRRATLDAELAQVFAGAGGETDEPWRVDYDVLRAEQDPPSGPADLRNLQLNRMIYLGDHDRFVRRLLRADYLSSERPARPGPRFLFELSHLGRQRARMQRHCGV